MTTTQAVERTAVAVHEAAPAGSEAARHRGERRARRRKAGMPYERTPLSLAFLTPWLIGVAGLVCLPLAWSLYLSFTDYNLLSDPEWVGWSNYAALFTQDQRYLHSLLLTLGYVVVSVPLQLSTALVAALVLAQARPGIQIYRSLFYLPSLLGASVAVSITWRSLFDYGGGVNSFLSTFGISEQSWVNDPDSVVWVIIALEIWKFGAPMIIFVAALQQIPRELREAAQVDGAGPWQRFRRVTVPMISPIILFNLVLGVIQAFQTFTPAQLVGDGRGGPADSTLFYAVNLYQQAFQYQRMGYASAIAWIMLIVLSILAALLFASSRRWVVYER